MTDRKTVIGVFESRSQAQLAVNELREAGFRDDQIGVTGRDYSASSTGTGTEMDEDEVKGSYAGEGALTGLAAGAGIGTLWGLGILAGVLPAIGPAIAAGALAGLLSSAAAGAAATGLAGALIGLGISKEEAEYYETEVRSGRILVTVHANGRSSEAVAIMRRHGGYDMKSGQSSQSTDSGYTSGSKLSSSTSSHGTSDRTSREQANLQAGTHTEGQQTIKAREEELRVRKEPVQTGEATVRKEVHTEHKTINVPVQREEIVIERHPVSGKADSGPIGEGQEIHIPISEEQIKVEKQAVVKEEVSIGKRQVQDTKQVAGTVRKEDIKVETKGDVKVRDDRKS